MSQNEDSRAICRYFRYGNCRFGDDCRFSHEGSHEMVSHLGNQYVSSEAINGHCGEEATFTRLSRNSNGFTVLESPSSEGQGLLSEKKRKSCVFYTSGYCKWGENCKFEHNDSSQQYPEIERITQADEYDKRGSSSCLPAESGIAAECVMASSGGDSATATQEKASSEYDQVEDEPECCICFNNPAKNTESNGKFGLLHNCDHIFCLDCIMKWRTSGSKEEYGEANECAYRRCPICRRKSNFVVSSKTSLKGDEREAFIEDFRRRAASMPCRNWQRTGICRLGHLCFYSHTRADGSDAKPAQKRLWENRREERRQRRVREGAQMLEVLLHLTGTLMPIRDTLSERDVYYLEELNWLQQQLINYLGRLGHLIE